MQNGFKMPLPGKRYAFRALTLLAGYQEEHLANKKE